VHVLLITYAMKTACEIMLFIIKICRCNIKNLRDEKEGREERNKIERRKDCDKIRRRNDCNRIDRVGGGVNDNVERRRNLNKIEREKIRIK